MATAKTITMDELLAGESVGHLTQGEVVDGTIMSVRKHEVLIDLGPLGVGFVPRREIGFGQKLEEGASVTASVVDTELDNGYSLLSLRKAAKDRGWDEVQRIVDDGETIEVTAYDANRGGLLIELEGVRGFLPVSQLSAEHYPRVGSSDKDEILQRLNSLVGKAIKVRILDADRKANKLIFSEKEAIKEGLADRFEKLKVGDTVSGVVNGVVDFGAFVQISPAVEALVHVSELGEGEGADPEKVFKLNERKQFKVLDVDKENRKISLSLKK